MAGTGSLDEPHAPIFFFAPFVSSTMRVDPAWIDYNGHMNVAYYHVLFDQAVEEAFGMVGLGRDYLEEREASFFVAEMHTRFMRELTVSDTVRITLQMLDFDGKRIHCYMEIRHAEEAWVAAVAENLLLHVDMTSRKVSDFPGDILGNLALMKAAHGRLARPDNLGRSIGIGRRRKRADEPVLAADTRH